MASYERGQSPESFEWSFKSTRQTEFESQGFKFDYANFGHECWCLKLFPNFNPSLKSYIPKPEPNSEYWDSYEIRHSPGSFELRFKKIDNQYWNYSLWSMAMQTLKGWFRSVPKFKFSSNLILTVYIYLYDKPHKPERSKYLVPWFFFLLKDVRLNL